MGEQQFEEASDKEKKRVAAYIRVSTADPAQQGSYELQERYFSDLLCRNPEWIFSGIYADYGISGTSGKKRTGFLRLLRHCREGKIDRIVTKSISRFARNTADFINALSILRAHHVTIYFERENLDTADPTNEFVMTALGAVAQEESRSVSENIRWGIRRRFARGEAQNLNIYGYRYREGEGAYAVTESGYCYRQVEVVPEEAVAVRRIFSEVIEGKSYASIARGLNRDRIPAPPENRAIQRQSDGKKQAYCEMDEGGINQEAGIKQEARINQEAGIKQEARIKQEGGIKQEAGINQEARINQEVGWTGGRVRSLLRLERYTGDLLTQKNLLLIFLQKR